MKNLVETRLDVEMAEIFNLDELEERLEMVSDTKGWM